MDGVKSTGFEGPFVQCRSTHPKWILKTLTWASGDKTGRKQ